MKQGEIFLVEIPVADGHEQQGLRPAIILSEAVANTTIVVPCTSNPEALRFPSTILIKPSRRNGLKIKSVALIFQIRAIDRKRLVRQIGRLENSVMSALKKLVKKKLSI